MNQQIPIDPKDWTVEDWRDLWNGIEQIRRSIASRHNPQIQPPTDNKFVAPGCEQFSSDGHYAERLKKAEADLKRMESAKVYTELAVAQANLKEAVWLIENDPLKQGWRQRRDAFLAAQRKGFACSLTTP